MHGEIVKTLWINLSLDALHAQFPIAGSLVVHSVALAGPDPEVGGF